MVELRKRPAPSAPAPARPAKKAATATAKAAGAKRGRKPKNATPAEEDEPATKEEKEAKEEKPDAEAPADAGKETKPAAAKVPAVGDTIDFEQFGAQIEDQNGKKVTLKQLVDDSEAGVVLFTYPKANTPGCTKQAVAFRDGHDFLSGTGLTIYGLSGDSPKSNTTFKKKQNLPFDLLCDPSYSLIRPVGMQIGSSQRTQRGVFAVDKKGKVLLSFQGGPIPTVDEVKKLVDSMES